MSVKFKQQGCFQTAGDVNEGTATDFTKPAYFSDLPQYIFIFKAGSKVNMLQNYIKGIINFQLRGKAYMVIQNQSNPVQQCIHMSSVLIISFSYCLPFSSWHIAFPQSELHV
jgi:hypothetical protein